jgi:D-aminopeptidase
VRARDHGFVPGQLPAGPFNAITDVAGVRVGHANHVPDHTGVTAVWPHGGDPWADWYFCATAALNGAGELTGTHEIEEWGCQETPILLTGTPYIGAVHAGVTHALTARQPRVGRDDVIIPVVGECDPSEWCDVREGPEPDDALVARALDSAAAGAVGEGQIGAGVGMETFGYAGGIGTASRVVGDHTLGVLVLSNFGLTERFVLCGRPVGRDLAQETARAARARASASSRRTLRCSAPAAPTRRRPFLGLASTGRTARTDPVRSRSLDDRQSAGARRDGRRAGLRAARRPPQPALRRVCRGGGGAVLNALCAGRDLRGYDGRLLRRFPAERYSTT